MVRTHPLNKGSELWLKIVFAILSPVLFLSLLEGVAYIWERVQANGVYAWEMVASRRLAFVPYAEPGDGYTLMAPGEHYQWQGIPVHINSRGLRGPEVSYEMPANTTRILNLGDSVVMGWGVREEDTYGRRLEQLLNSRANGDRRYEVINAGVPGWNLANAAAYLEAEGLSYRPSLIILSITVANDINGKSALNAIPPPSLLDWLRTHTHFWPFLMIQARTLQARLEGQQRIDTINPPTNPEKYFPRDPAAERWNEVWRWIEHIHQRARANDIPLLIVVFPLEYQVLDDDYPVLAQEILTARAAADGILALDLLPQFRQACRQKPGGPCQLEDRFLFADVWMHPSSSGHELASTELEQLMSKALAVDMSMGALNR